MASVISSTPPNVPTEGALTNLAATLAAARGERILFALRLPLVERVAWLEGRARASECEFAARDAFARICRRTLRRGDVIAHEAGSNLFLAALLETGAKGDLPRIAHVVLREITGQLERATGFEVHGGWTIYRTGDDSERAVREAASLALERGRRERERYAFFSTFGHEMRTPLMSIDGYLATLLESELDPATRRRFTEIAQLEAVRLRRLVDSMYALSLIDLDAEVVRNVSCSVQRAVESACDVIFPAAARRGTRVHVCSAVEAAIPWAAEHAVQMFVSLLENAVKHGRQNGRIEIHLHEAPAHVMLHFDDDGPGISEDQRPLIFEPLVRGRDAGAAGHGLGLSIVRTTVERAGGDISTAVSPLGGARFTLRLPRADVVAQRRESH